MDIKSALEKLYSMHQFGIKLGLEKTYHLLEQIDNPHKNLKCIHIAGSNGKGSTSSFIASILTEAGYKVGLYTSPHFVKFNERIRINGEMIDDEYIARFVDNLQDYIEENQPTFFETTTALAFKYFYEQKVDYAVVETGLGGRLDATNVIHPIASVITSISLEHTEHLGNTIDKIAVEKGGIIKTNMPVLIGKLPTEAKNVIREISDRLNCRLTEIENCAAKEDGRVVLSLGQKKFSIYKTPLRGAYQLWNAALAVKTVAETLNIADGLILSRGIGNVIPNTGISGRYETFSSNPRIIFDSAHNVEGIENFIHEFSKESNQFSERILIFGAMRDKAIESMLSKLAPYFDKILLTRVNIERAADITELTVAANNAGIEAVPIADSSEYIREFVKLDQNKCLAVLGSMYLLGEIKSKFLKKGLDNS
ncbi:MAG: folylpolyglutamate synthase/dihydrofolate synthase family protein [Bacteroidota bacterium]